MSTPPTQPPGEVPANPIAEQMALLKFLREESEANRDSLNKQADADRSLLKHIAWIVWVPVSIALAGATWLGYSSISTLKQEIQEQAKASGRQAIAETTAGLKKDIPEQVKKEFQTPKIEHTVHDAAIEATTTVANPLIRNAVKLQVGVEVAAHSRQIETIAKNAVDEKVTTTIAPLAAEASKMLDQMQTQQRIALAQSDDARAFDQLLPLSDHNPTVAGVIKERQRYARVQLLRYGVNKSCLDPQSTDFKSRLGRVHTI